MLETLAKELSFNTIGIVAPINELSKIELAKYVKMAK